MSNLVPVKRQDKNGRLVTRHVRQGDAGSSEKSVIPSPTVIINDENERKLSHIAEMITDVANEIKIAGLDQETQGHLIKMADHLNISANAAILWRLMNPRKFAEGRYLDVLALPRLEDELRLLATFHRMDRNVPLVTTLSFVRGLYAYDDLPDTPDSDDKKQAVIDVAVASMEMLQELPNAYEDPSYDDKDDYVVDEDKYLSCLGGDLEDDQLGQMWLRNDELVGLVSRRHTESERIIEIIQTRKTVQPDTIEALLDFESHDSLADGAL